MLTLWQDVSVENKASEPGVIRKERESSLCSCTLTGAKSASTIALEEI